MKKVLILFLFIVFALPFISEAHEPNHSYIFLRINQESINGRFEIGRLELNQILGLSLSETLKQKEVDEAAGKIKDYILNNVQFNSESKNYELVLLEVKAFNLDEEDDNIQISFELNDMKNVPNSLTISYKPFFDNLSDHKGILIIEYHWKGGIIDNHFMIAEVFEADNVTKTIDLRDVSVWKGFVAMVKLGVWHIWIGIDHILFLVALVLPAVVRRKTDRHQIETLSYSIDSVWNPVARFKPAALYILKIVTFFTIAHSITLAIAALDVFTLPSRYVESIIAFSIALAAFHNIRPIFKSKEWVVAFVFGLFHGFGFASVLGEKGLGGDYFILSLLGFNGGVELGQVAIILGIFPLLYLIRKFNFYPKFLTYGSGLLILISLHWSIERLFEVNIPIGRWLGGLFGFIQPFLSL